MIRLVGFEIKKLIALRAPCLILAALALLGALSGWLRVREVEKIPEPVRRDFYDAYRADPQGMRAQYEELREFEDQQFELFFRAEELRAHYEPIPWTNRYTDLGGGDAELFSELFERERFVDSGFGELVEGVLDGAKAVLRQMGDSRKGYTALYQYRILELYGDLEDRVELKLSRPTGWSVWFDMKERVLLLFAAAVVLAVSVYGFDGGAGQILRISENGVRPTGAAKLISLALLSAVFALVFSAASLAGIALGAGGLGDPANGIQSVAGMELFFLPLSILEAFILSVVFLAAGSVCLIFILSPGCAALKSAVGGVIWGAVVTGAFFIADAASGVLSRISLVSLMTGSAFFNRFRALDIFGVPADEQTVARILLILTAAVCLAASVLLFCLPNRGLRVSRSAGNKFSRRKNSSGIKKSALWKRHGTFELLKLLRSPGVILFAVFLLLSGVVISRISTFPEDSLNERIYLDYTSQYSGEATPQKLEAISAECERFDAILDLRQENQERFDRGELSPQEYRDYLNELYRAETRSACAGVLKARLERLEGTKGRIMYDSGVRRLLELPARPTLFLLAAFLGAAAMLWESADTVSLIRISRRGIGKVRRSKLLTVILLCVGAAALDLAFELCFCLGSFGGFCASAPLYSLDGFSGEFPIWACLLLKLPVTALSLCAVGAASLAIFSLTGRSSAAVIAVSVPLGLGLISGSARADLTRSFNLTVSGAVSPALIGWTACAILIWVLWVFFSNKTPETKGVLIWS